MKALFNPCLQESEKAAVISEAFAVDRGLLSFIESNPPAERLGRFIRLRLLNAESRQIINRFNAPAKGKQ